MTGVPDTPQALTVEDVAAIRAQYPDEEKHADIHALADNLEAAWARLEHHCGASAGKCCRPCGTHASYEQRGYHSGCGLR